MNCFYERVYENVKKIPKGKVATYGTIAAMCGNPRASRSVAAALHRNPEPGVVPCHRVVFSDGSLARNYAFGGRVAQKKLLKEEGVPFLIDGRVELLKCFFMPWAK